MAVVLDKKNAVAVVKVSRPEAMNALNSGTLAELLDTAGTLAGDASIRAVVLTGEGDQAFVAGADIGEMRGMTAEQARRFSLLGRRVTAAIEKSPKPWIAAVNGHALGGGCELALACDIRFAADNASLGQPEVGLGITPGFGATQRLPRVVGMGWAKFMCLSGRPIDADEALRIGLVQAVVPGAQLMPRVLKFAQEMATKSPLTLSYIKTQVQRALDVDMDSGQEMERDIFALCFATEDQDEGMAAFLEKREPRFKGR